jgi:hypothetical protein
LNKGAPGLDGQDFADIEAYGVERWLGELALALREETYRPVPEVHALGFNQPVLKRCGRLSERQSSTVGRPPDLPLP